MIARDVVLQPVLDDSTGTALVLALLLALMVGGALLSIGQHVADRRAARRTAMERHPAGGRGHL